MDALEKTATKKEMTKTAVIRLALRLYDFIDRRQSEGAKLFVQDTAAKKTELVVL